MVHPVDYALAVSAILTAARAHQGLAATALAVHGVMTGVLDPVQRYRLNHLDLVLPDGQPVRWALRWLHGARLPDRVYGPALMLKLCQRAAEEGLPVFLYGSRPEVLAALRRNLCARYPALEIAGAQPSCFARVDVEEQRRIARAIRASGAALVFCGLGCPRQEVWVYENRDLVGLPLVAVGAAFDFHAGKLAQAPIRWQNLGLEWLYRWLHEPRRLWRRYLLLNPAYLTLLLFQRTGLRRFDPAADPAPQASVGYA